MADSEKDMTQMLGTFNKILHAWRLRINVRKTKIMVVSKKRVDIKSTIMLNNTILEHVTEFCYLGSIVTSGNKCLAKIKRRVACLLYTSRCV